MKTYRAYREAKGNELLAAAILPVRVDLLEGERGREGGEKEGEGGRERGREREK